MKAMAARWRAHSSAYRPGAIAGMEKRLLDSAEKIFDFDHRERLLIRGRRMDFAHRRRFAEALGSWMHFEMCCFKAGLFSENSFKSAIGSVASSIHASHRGARVHADYQLAAIQKVPDSERKLSGGRKRSVDFALIYDDGREPPSEPEILIEAKWAGSSHCSTANIFADFIRLALMKRAHPDATCLFVLAGKKSDVREILSMPPFEATRRRSDGIEYGKGERKFVLDPASTVHAKHFSAPINAFHKVNLEVPAEFLVIGTSPYPNDSTTSSVKFQAIAWEICSVGRRNVVASRWPVPTKRTKTQKELKGVIA